VRIILQTRCGCNQFREIEVGQAPANIVVQLSDNQKIGLNQASSDEPPQRRFTYIGTQKGTNVPIYVEHLDEEGFEIDQPLSTVASESYEQQQPETD
jgi:hypothetical protein